jgi:hypothetical protein
MRQATQEERFDHERDNRKHDRPLTSQQWADQLLGEYWAERRIRLEREQTDAQR